MVFDRKHVGFFKQNFPDLHRVIMNFESWLRGTHHRVSNLQAYIDEYCYRFNRNKMKEGIFDNLLMRMVRAKPMIENKIKKKY